MIIYILVNTGHIIFLGDICINIKIVTKEWANENSWTFGSCSSNDTYQNYATVTEQCCQPAGQYELVCKCSYGDGWHGGYLEINGQRYCEEFKDGKEKKETATIPERKSPFCIIFCSFNIVLFNIMWLLYKCFTRLQLTCN